MKNKLGVIIWVFLGITAFIIVIYLKSIPVVEKDTNPLLDEKVLSGMWMHQVSELKPRLDLDNPIIKLNINKYIEGLYEVCNSIVAWNLDWNMEWYWFRSTYLDALDVIENNEYVAKNNLVNGECDEFTWENKLHCEIFVSKDLTKLENNKSKLPLYNYVLLKSQLSWVNTCKNLLTEDDQTDCDKTYKEYLSNNSISAESITMYSDKMKLGKYLLENWEKKYIEKINNSFLGKCNYYVDDFKIFMFTVDKKLWEAAL